MTPEELNTGEDKSMRKTDSQGNTSESMNDSKRPSLSTPSLAFPPSKLPSTSDKAEVPTEAVKPAAAKSDMPPLTAPIAGLLMIISGVASIHFMVVANRQVLKTCDTCAKEQFFAPFWQSFLFHSSALVMVPIYVLDRYTSVLSSISPKLGISYFEGCEKPSSQKYLWFCAAALDVVAAVCAATSYLYVAAPIARMLMAFNILITVVLRRFWFKRTPALFELLGASTVMMGLVVAGLAAIINTDKGRFAGREYIGILCALTAAFCYSMNFTVQEYIFSNYKASPLEGTVFVGLFGVILDSILLGIVKGIGYEDTGVTFYQMFSGQENSGTLLGANFIVFFSMTIFSISGEVVLTRGSPVLRCVANTCRTAGVWFVGLAVGQPFKLIVCFAMIIIIIGVAVYHYNFYCKVDSWQGDAVLRKQVLCECSCAKKQQELLKEQP